MEICRSFSRTSRRSSFRPCSTRCLRRPSAFCSRSSTRSTTSTAAACASTGRCAANITVYVNDGLFRDAEGYQDPNTFDLKAGTIHDPYAGIEARAWALPHAGRRWLARRVSTRLRRPGARRWPPRHPRSVRRRQRLLPRSALDRLGAQRRRFCRSRPTSGARARPSSACATAPGSPSREFSITRPRSASPRSGTPAAPQSSTSPILRTFASSPERRAAACAASRACAESSRRFRA